MCMRVRIFLIVYCHYCHAAAHSRCSTSHIPFSSFSRSRGIAPLLTVRYAPRRFPWSSVI